MKRLLYFLVVICMCACNNNEPFDGDIFGDYNITIESTGTVVVMETTMRLNNFGGMYGEIVFTEVLLHDYVGDYLHFRCSYNEDTMNTVITDESISSDIDISGMIHNDGTGIIYIKKYRNGVNTITYTIVILGRI